MAIIYEDPLEGLHARRFANRLVTGVIGKRELNLGIWNFEALGISEIRNVAASAAAVADVVILSMSGSKALSPMAKEWIAMWSWLMDRGKPAIIALFAKPGGAGSLIQTDLKRTALLKGLDFFAAVGPQIRQFPFKFPNLPRKQSPAGDGTQMNRN